MSIKTDAELIRDETTSNANTATRVGNNLVAIADELETINSLETLTLGFFGQSNMNCVITGETDGGDKELNLNVTVWNSNSSAYETADLDKFPFGERPAFINNSEDGTTTGNNNIAFHTAKRIQEETGKNVRIIFLALGGQPIERWIATDGDPSMWTATTDMLTASGVTKLDAISFYQGESNSGDEGAEYGAKVETLRQQFRDLGITDKKTPFIMAEVAPAFDNINGSFFNYPNYINHISDEYFTVVKAKDLTFVDSNQHLDATSIVTISDRFANAFFTIPKSYELAASGLLTNSIAKLWHENPNGVDAGSSVSGYQQRVLNNFYDPNGNIIKQLVANRFILRAGTYKVNGYTTVNGSGNAKGTLINVTDTTFDVIGLSVFSGTDILATAIIADIFTITEDKEFEVNLWCENAKATDGLGIATGNGLIEKYTYLEITKA